MSKSKFIEGKKYLFKLIKIITLEEEFYILEDIYKKRHMLSTFYFKNYDIKVNDNIECYIDNVDCNGKTVLEPEHPHYKLNTEYFFKFVKLKVVEDTPSSRLSTKSHKNIIYDIIVEDIYGNEHNVEPYEWQKRKTYKPKTIKCKLERITRGYFVLINKEPLNNKRKISKFFEKLKGLFDNGIS